MQTPPFGVTIVHDTVVFFMSIHMNDCSRVHSCVAYLWCVPLLHTYAHIEHIYWYDITVYIPYD